MVSIPPRETLLGDGTMTTTDTADRGGFDIGRVIQQTFAVLGRNIVPFIILGVVLVGIPRAIVGYFQVGMMRGQIETIASGDISFMGGYFGGAGMGLLAALITGAILQGALIYATVRDLNGQPASVGESLATGLRNFLPLIVVSLLAGIAIICGLVLLIVPGIMLACAWSVAVPAVVADRVGIFESFGRSAELTRGNRWQIFALAILVLVISFVLGMIVNAILGVSMMAADPSAALDKATSPLGLALSAISSTLSGVIGATGAAVLYVELRNARDGAGPGWLADIFR